MMQFSKPFREGGLRIFVKNIQRWKLILNSLLSKCLSRAEAA